MTEVVILVVGFIFDKNMLCKMIKHSVIIKMYF